MNWSSILNIYYNPAQEDGYNTYLQTAAQELQDYLGQMSGRTFNVVTDLPAEPAIFLNADPAALPGNGPEAYHLIIGDSIEIIGNSALACRHGAYALLNKLGVRWYYKDPAWWIVPNVLITLGNIDEISEPAYDWRALRFYPNINGRGNTAVWARRNRLGGLDYFRAAETYGTIYPSSKYATDPASFYPTDMGATIGWPWQLNPDSENVKTAALSYALDRLSRAPVKIGSMDSITFCDDYVMQTPCISPNDTDITGWNPPLSAWQDVTDAVYRLVNHVALNVQSAYPGRYVSILSYASWSGVPVQTLEPNICVFVCTDYNYTSVSLTDRITGIVTKGAKAGIYDYYGVWEWHKDKPVQRFEFLPSVASYHNLGATVFYTENGDDWGVKGLTYYMLSNLLWNPEQTIDDMMADMCDRCFGPAAPIMLAYYQNIGSSYSALDATFDRLAQAEAILVSDAQAIERIRQLQYYCRFVWKRHLIGLDNLSEEELVGLYKLLTKTRDYSLVNYDADETEVRGKLKSRFPTNYPSDAAVYTLQDFNLPTETDAQSWLAEAQAYFSTNTPPVNIYDKKLVPLDDTVSHVSTPLSGMNQVVIIPSDGNETVTIRVKGSINPQTITCKWYSANWYGSTLLQTISVSAIKDVWTDVPIQITEPGFYKFVVTGALSFAVSVDVANHPASLEATSSYPYPFWSLSKQYFYVPEGTAAFIFGLKAVSGSTDLTATITAPSGAQTQHIFAPNISAEYTYDSPENGLWSVSASLPYAAYLWFRGIPSLIWHNPQYLLIQGDPLVPETGWILSVNSIGSGTTIPFGSENYNDGDIVHLSAEAESGYVFVKWEENGQELSRDPAIYIAVSSDRSITAVFETIVNVVNLTVEQVGEGILTPTVGTHQYISDETVIMTAEPAQGWKFSHWEGAVSSSDSVTSFIITSDNTIKGIFTKISSSNPIVAGALGVLLALALSRRKK